MPHVELSLIDSRARLRSTGSAAADRSAPGEARLPRARDGRQPRSAPSGSLHRWAAVVDSAAEPSLVIDADTLIVAASAPCAEMVGLGDPAAARGRRLREAMVHLVDFTDPPDALDNAEADKIPPLLAIASGRLARGLMRVVAPGTGQPSTMDAVSTPLWQGTTVTGSLTFFSRV